MNVVVHTYPAPRHGSYAAVSSLSHDSVANSPGTHVSGALSNPLSRQRLRAFAVSAACHVGERHELRAVSVRPALNPAPAQPANAGNTLRRAGLHLSPLSGGVLVMGVQPTLPGGDKLKGKAHPQNAAWRSAPVPRPDNRPAATHAAFYPSVRSARFGGRTDSGYARGGPGVTAKHTPGATGSLGPHGADPSLPQTPPACGLGAFSEVA